MKLEIACFNLASALIAQASGADRVELCAGYREGGLAPAIDMVKEARRRLMCEVFVMIRPRGGDFVYTHQEFGEMKRQLLECKNEGADGFVFGVLNKDKTPDTKRNAALVKLAGSLPCTFHRAFDQAPDPFHTIGALVDAGFKTVLTSGRQSTALAGAGLINELIMARGKEISIMPGGGVRSGHLARLVQATKATYYHSSGITGSDEVADEKEIRALKSRLMSLSSTGNRVGDLFSM